MNCYVVSFPRSGTHFLINSILQNVENYKYFIDFESPKIGQNLDSIYENWCNVSDGNFIIKTHCFGDVAGKFLSKKSKVIYIARDPRDVMVSYWHYLRRDEFKKWNRHLPSFADCDLSEFISSKYPEPYTHGLTQKKGMTVIEAWIHHFESWKKLVKDENLDCLFVTYEKLNNNFQLSIFEISNFLNSEKLTFEKPDINNSFSHLPRKGIVGDHENHFCYHCSIKTDKAKKIYENNN